MSQPHTPRPRGNPSEIWAWCFYDWAQSAYSTLQITVVVLYLTKVVWPGNGGAYLYSYGISATMLCTALLSPVLGALADAHASKRRWLWITTVPSVAAAMAMAFAPEDQTLLIAALFLVMNLGYELSQGFYNAFLTEIVPEEEVDRISARGYAVGYVGGGLALLVALVVLMKGQWFGLPADTRYDLHATRAGTFRVDVPPGEYRVTITAGDPHAERHGMRYAVNGASLPPIDAKAGEFVERTKQVQADGQIRVSVAEDDPQGLAVINHLSLARADGAPWLAFDFGGASSPNDPGAIWVAPDDTFQERPLFDGAKRYKPVAGAAPDATIPPRLAFGWESGQIVGVDRIAGPRMRVGLAILGVWWGLFSLPALLILQDRSAPRAASEGLLGAAREAFGQVASTLGRVRRYRTLFLFLAAFLIYNDGIQTIINQASLFADRALHVKEDQLIAVILMIQFLALPGALFVGWLSGRWGQKPTLVACLVIYMLWLCAAYFITTFTHLLGMGAVLALIMGGSQSVSRAMMARLTPQQHAGEFFGFFSFAAKATSLVGPALFVTVLNQAGNPYWAILSLLVFFVVGLLLLLPVDVERGRREAAGVEAEPASPSSVATG